MKESYKTRTPSRTLLACLLSFCITFMMMPAMAFANDDSSDSAVYVLMNIPYSVFYGAEGATVADVDAVTSATNKVGNYGKAGGAYHSGTSASVAEDGTVTATGGDTGAIVKGVIWPVKAGSIDDVKALGGKEITDKSSVVTATVGRGQANSQTLYGYETLTEAAEYSYYVLESAPDYYAVLSDGKITAVQGDSVSKDGAGVAVSYGTNWGDVQFALTGIDDASAGLVNAVVFTTKDGDKVGLYHLDQVWAAESIGWKVAATAGLDGTTITNIRYYCSVKDSTLTDEEAPAYVNYVYDYPVNVDVAEVYTGEVTAEFTDANTITLSGLPEDAKNVKAKVYYTTGGRGATYTYLTPLVVDPADDDIDPTTVDVVDGKITIEAGSVTNNAGTTQTYGNPIGGTTYTVELSSDNYIIHKASAVHPGYYVLMNVPYDKFYAAEGVEGVDAVTSSTVKTYNTGMAGGSYHKGSLTVTDPDTDDPISDAKILGVTYPVYVSDITVLKDQTEVTDDTTATITVASGKSSRITKDVTGSDVLFASGDYAYYVMSSVPANYKTLTVNDDGSFGFSAVKNSAEGKELKSATLLYSGHYTNLTLTVAEADDATDISGSNLSGILLTAGGETYALRHVEDVWKKTEIGWNWDGLDGSGLSGKTITNITYYMQDGGVYSYDVNVSVKTHYEETVSAEFESSKVVAVSGLPEDIENPKATVSVTVNRVTTTLVSNAEIADGKIALDTAATYGTTYTVKVASDNYADISTTAAAEWSSEAAAADVKAAKEAVADAQDAVDKALESGDSDKIKEAVEALVEAQNALTTAQEVLNTVQTSENDAEIEELKAEIDELNDELEDLTEKLSEAQVVDISNFAATLGGVEGYSATYTGKAIKPAVSVAGVAASNYTVSYSNNVNAGTAKVTIAAKSGSTNYKGTITKTFKINKAANGLKVKASAKKVKAKKLKKKKQVVAALKVSGQQGKVTYKKASGSKKLKVNASTGKITVKKGTKKGTYKAVIAVTAKGDSNHKAVTKKVKVTIKVK